MQNCVLGDFRLSLLTFILMFTDYRRQREAVAAVDEAEGSFQLPLSSDGLQLTRVSEADVPETAENSDSQVPTYAYM